MSHLTVLLLYSAGILCASLAGGLVPLAVELPHRRLQLAVSFVAGIILGIAVFHLLPHAIEHTQSGHTVANYLLLGLLAMFFLERFFCFHHHDVEHECEHGGQHSHPHAHEHTLTWSGTVIGLGVHSVLNGMALAAGVAADESGAVLPGFGVFLAVVLHKPFDALTIGTLMTARGVSVKKRMLVNALFALAVPAGIALFYCGLQAVVAQDFYVGRVLAASVGIFLCISLSDLLPELQFHAHDRIKLSVALLCGIGLAWIFGQVEMEQHRPQHHLHAE